MMDCIPHRDTDCFEKEGNYKNKKQNIDFTHIQKRLQNPRTDLPENQYEYWVDKTAKLLKRKYMQVHLIFEKEKWTLEKIRDRYKQCTERNGEMPKDVLWWYLRKQDKET